MGALALFALVAFAVSALLTWRLLGDGPRRLLMDYPNERSLHARPVPRGGGLAIASAVYLAGFMLSLGSSLPDWAPWLAASGLLIVSVSFVDDLSHVHPAGRIAVHLTAVLLLVVGAGLALETIEVPGTRWPLPAWLGVAATCLLVVWLVNLYNFMDGMDGFAAGMAAIGFTTYAVLGLRAQAPGFAGLALVTAAAAAGFLVFNFPPARIFMGDVGSSLLGFVAGALTVWAERDGLFPLWVGVLVFSPFVVDATATLVRRAWRREKVWRPHRTHGYQRLVRLGWSHRRTVLWEYALMLCCSGSAMIAVALAPSQQWVLIGGWTVAYAALVFAVRRLEGGARDHDPAPDI